jgi:class 3 adenylate cyclase
MPLYIDIHELPGITTAAAGEAHVRDLEAQGSFGVDYTKYWINEKSGKVFCLCDAPSAEAAMQVHRQAHGAGAERIIEVTPELADLFMGPSATDATGAALLPPDSEGTHDTATRTLLFTDIVDSTAITQRLGDAEAMKLVQNHDAIVRGALTATGGREVKHTGDGIMAVFVSAAVAITCAVQIQQALVRYNGNRPDLPLHVRIGLAAGEPVERRGDFFGTAVQLAARLCAHAEPAQILVSTAVADLCAGKNFCFQDIGEVTLKGFDQAVYVRGVDWTAAT